MLALEGGQVILNLVILRVFEADIIVDTSSFLAIPNDKLAKTIMPTWELHQSHQAYLLEKIDQFRQRLVSPILDLIPLESAKILINRL